MIIHGVGPHGFAHNILVRHCIGLACGGIGADVLKEGIDKIQPRLKGVELNAPFESGNHDATFSRTIPADS